MFQFLIILLSSMLINTAIAQPVNICDDVAGWAPYVYFPMVDGKQDRSRIEGATADLIKAIFELIEMDYSLKLIPWARCLLEVENFGVHNNYEMLADCTYTDERAKKYWITTPIYKTRMGAFYSTKKFPENFVIKKPQELNQYKLGGVRGYNYKPYIDAGVKDKIYKGSGSNRAAIAMLSLNRFDFFLSAVEPVYGLQEIGEIDIPKHIKHIIVPDTKEYLFRLFVSKTSPRSYELYTKVNQAIISIQSTGVADKIFKKYLPGGDGL